MNTNALTRIAMLLAAAFCIAGAAASAGASTEESRQVVLDGSFDPEGQTYSATVAHDVTEITVTARPSDPKARVTSAVRGDPGFEVNLDLTRREAANAGEPAEHGVMLRSAIRW